MGVRGLAIAVALSAVVYFVVHKPLSKLIVGSMYPHAQVSFPMTDWATREIDPWANTNSTTGGDEAAVVKFNIAVSDAELEDLDRRLRDYRGWDAATPMNHTSDNEHWTWGIPQANLTALVTHWRVAYDWRRFESEINNELFATHIDGLRIVFKLLLPAGEGAPKKPAVLLLHGWPGSIVEFTTLQELIRADGHPVVVPCMPGYGYSTAPQREGYDTIEAATTYLRLMRRLKYDKFLVQGGDWGGLTIESLVRVAPDQVLGAHTNFAIAPGPPTIAALVTSLLFDSEEEQARASPPPNAVADSIGYMLLQATRPETLGAALSDSPVGLLAWIVEKFHGWSDSSKPLLDKFSADELLTNVMMYWTSNSFTSSARFYKENLGTRSARAATALAEPWPDDVPVAVAIFPFEIFPANRRFVEGKYGADMVHAMEKGGHFAAAEEPELLFGSFKKFVDSLQL